MVWYWMPRYQSHRPVPYPYRDLHLPLRLRPHVRDRTVSPPHTHSISLDRTPTSACDWSGRGPAGHEILSPVARCTNAHTKCIQNGDSPPPLPLSLSPSHPTSGGEETIKRFGASRGRIRKRGRQQGTHTLEHKRYQTYKWLFSGPTCAPPGPPAQRAATGVAAPSAPRSAPPPACRYELGTEIEES